MTMPNERTRSLRWGYEALVEMRDNAELQDVYKLSAAAMLDMYPAPSLVSEWISAELRHIPLAAAAAIDAAGKLFIDLSHSDRCPDEIRKALSFVLRHYPLRGEAEPWALDVNHEPITDWLMPEDCHG
jgi:hypothetical protein